MNTSEILVRIIQRMPYPDQIHGLEINDDCVRFAWRGHQFRVNKHLSTETVRDGFISGSDIAIITQKLLQLETK